MKKEYCRDCGVPMNQVGNLFACPDCGGSRLPSVSMSAMWTDNLRDEIQKRAPEGGYPIECHENTNEFRWLQAAAQQGIDSYLEAIHFQEFNGTHGRRGFRIDRETLHVLVRRLMEAEFSEADEARCQDSPQSYASSICETLNIELI